MQQSAFSFAARCITLNISPSSIISTPGYAMKSLKLVMPSATIASISSRPSSSEPPLGERSVMAMCSA